MLTSEMGVTSVNDTMQVEYNSEKDHPTTVFVDSEEVVTHDVVMNQLELLPVRATDDYKLYYKRPFRVTRGLITQNDGASWRHIMTWPSEVSSWYTQKLQGVFAFRGPLHVRLVVNANKMQSGILRLRAIPAMTTQTPLAFNNGQHLAYLINQTSMSTLPGFDIDLACSHTGEIELPWIFPESAVISVNEQRWVICLSMYVPLGVGDSGSATIDYTVYYSHPDFVAYGASGVDTFQSGRAKAQEKKEAGIVTRTLGKMSESFNHMTPIPFIGSYMKSLSSISASLSKAASVWGWSSMPIFTPHHRMVQDAIGSTNVTNQPKVVRFMGPIAGSGTPEGKPIGPSNDELAISSITSRYAYVSSFDFENQVAGEVLWTSSVNPWNFFTFVNGFTGVDNSYQRFVYTPLTYCSRMFASWRGTIRYRFDMGKTQFHSGRIVIVYSPVNSMPLDNQFTYRKVVDISEVSHFEFEVPFVFPYSLPLEDTLQGSAGTLRILVVDDLQAPSTVRKRIQTNVSVSGGSDFTLSNYVGRTQGSVIEPAPCEAIGAGFTFQSGCMRDTETVEEVVESEHFDVANTGIVQRSFRNLLRAETFLPLAIRDDVGAVTLAFGNGSWTNTANYRVLNPFSSYLVPPRSYFASAPAWNYEFSFDLYSALAPLFYGSKGGVRLRVSSTRGDTTNPRYHVRYLTKRNLPINGSYLFTEAEAFVAPSALSNMTTRWSPAFMDSLPESSVLYEFPQSINKPFRPNQQSIFTASNVASTLEASVNPNSQRNFVAVSANVPFNLTRSTAEDFDFMFFLGVPIQTGVLAPVMGPQDV